MNDNTGKYDLNSLVGTYNIDNEYEQYKRLEFIGKLQNYIDLSQSAVLELGSATGAMTAMLSYVAKQVVAVDGSSEFINIAKSKVGGASNVIFYESYFENLSLNEQYDCIILHHILEHIENPTELLAKLQLYLKPDGLLAISVPNAQALSRKLAVVMGLLGSVYELSENDRNHGHYRIYDWHTLGDHVCSSGYTIIAKHGLSFKLFSDRQNIMMMEAGIIGEEQIKGLWQIGDELPEYAGAMMVVAKGIQS